MGQKAISVVDINKNTYIAECSDGFWLRDKARGMNLAIRAKNERSALIKALEYYQRRLPEVEAENKELKGHINGLLESLGIDKEI